MDQTEALLDLNHKIDLLTAQVQALTAHAEQQQRRQQEWDELKADLTPILFDAYQASVEQLAEVEAYVRPEDFLRLLKRLARNTRNLEGLLDQLESLSDLLHDLSPILNDAVFSAIGQMDVMERRGYFALAREGGYVLDRVANAFGPQDVRQLGDNVVTILTTVKDLTQPEIMATVQNLTGRMRQGGAAIEQRPPTLFDLLRQLRDPQVRRGLNMTLSMLKAMGEEPARASAAPAAH